MYFLEVTAFQMYVVSVAQTSKHKTPHALPEILRNACRSLIYTKIRLWSALAREIKQSKAKMLPTEG